MLPPLPPPPHRNYFRSDKEYLAARNRYAELRKQHDESLKTDMAMLILMVAAFCAVGVGGSIWVAYLASGWRGVAALLSVAGLLWVAFVQIRRRL